MEVLQRREGREGGSEGDGAGVADLIFSAMRWGVGSVVCLWGGRGGGRIGRRGRAMHMS